jgi:hypothetical protein
MQSSSRSHHYMGLQWSDLCKLLIEQRYADETTEVVGLTVCSMSHTHSCLRSNTHES